MYALAVAEKRIERFVLLPLVRAILAITSRLSRRLQHICG
jgi:hypothetical protein